MRGSNQSLPLFSLRFSLWCQLKGVIWVTLTGGKSFRKLRVLLSSSDPPQQLIYEFLKRGNRVIQEVNLRIEANKGWFYKNSHQVVSCWKALMGRTFRTISCLRTSQTTEVPLLMKLTLEPSSSMDVPLGQLQVQGRCLTQLTTLWFTSQKLLQLLNKFYNNNPVKSLWQLMFHSSNNLRILN